MGNTIPPNSVNTQLFNSNKNKTQYNIRVALWQLPYDRRYGDYDTDESHWFEAANKKGENEIEEVEKKLQIRLNKFMVQTKMTQKSDNSIEEVSLYPNGNEVKVSKNSNSVFVSIRNKLNELVAEKIYNKESNDARKVIYKHIKQGENTFTIVRIYSYDTTKNRTTDIINYGYTSLESSLTKGCQLEKEYYMLDGREVKAVKMDLFEYKVKDEHGKKFVFIED